MTIAMLIEYGKPLLLAGIPAFIVLRTVQMAVFSLRNGKREAALVFLAYACALAAATVAYFATEDVGFRRDTPFHWVVGLCFVYGIVGLITIISALGERQYGTRAARHEASAGAAVGGAGALAIPLAEDEPLCDPLDRDDIRSPFYDPVPEVTDPAYSSLPGNINYHPAP